ncbi:MAG: hypothetical protein FWG14_00010 [Peptococcaceae bacterium]|nr:hypothetical protein [Peptococcaceae bacterium]
METNTSKTNPQNSDPKVPQRIIHHDEAASFLTISRKASLLIAVGVALILFGASIVVGLVCFVDLFGGDDDFAASLSVIPLLLLVIPAVGFFIYAGLGMEKYKYIESGEFETEASVQHELTKEYEERRPKYIMGIVAGVGLILLSAVVFIAVDIFVPAYESLSVSLLLWMITAAVFILIRTGMADSAYKKLLGLGDYAPSARSQDKVIGAVAAFVWPLVTCIFLVWGLVFQGFHIAWIVFPITGILFGGFAGLYSTLKGK